MIFRDSLMEYLRRNVFRLGLLLILIALFAWKISQENWTAAIFWFILATGYVLLVIESPLSVRIAQFNRGPTQLGLLALSLSLVGSFFLLWGALMLVGVLSGGSLGMLAIIAGGLFLYVGVKGLRYVSRVRRDE